MIMILIGFNTVKCQYNIEMKTKQTLRLISKNFGRETILLGIRETLYN